MNTMRSIAAYCALLISLSLWAGNRVLLAPERWLNVHVGQIVVLQMPSDRRYAIEAAGSALLALKPSPQKGTAVYPSVHAGLETLILTPAGLTKGQCITLCRATLLRNGCSVRTNDCC